MFELATNATTTPTAIDLNLVATWALVVVALATVLVTAIQNWKTQKLMAQQTRVMSEQMKQAIAQTQLQQEQFGEMLLDRERPRVEELIRVVLSFALGFLDRNIENSKSTPFADATELVNSLAKNINQVVQMAFSDFRSKYPELVKEMQDYDGILSAIRAKRHALDEALLKEVNIIFPERVRDYNATALPNAKIDEQHLDPSSIVRGIWQTLQGQDAFVRSELELVWIQNRDEFIALAKKPDPNQVIAELNHLASKCIESGESLAAKLRQIREQLGTKYKIPREHYF